MAQQAKPIFVIRRKVTHAGHHGGAWKVAYADFVTAMMALFIVLWLMSSTSKPVQESIGGYFRDPQGVAAKKGTDKDGGPVKVVEKQEDMTKLKQQLMAAVHNVAALNKLEHQIEITLTPEGLRVEMLEDPKGTFFEEGSAQPTPVMRELLKVLAEQMGTLPNKISIEGHTDAHPYSNSGGYSNWELSSDRANVARRLMQASGVRADQVSQVRGFADQRLRKPQQPFDASNRRISVIVENLPQAGPAVAPISPGGKEPSSIAAPSPAPSPAQVPGRPPSPAGAPNTKPSPTIPARGL